MNDSDHRNEIVRLEERIDELTARIENCRKFILAGQIAITAGVVVLSLMLVGLVNFSPAVLALTVAVVLGGIVAAGSNHSTAKQAMNELTAAEAERKALIDQIELRLVAERNPL